MNASLVNLSRINSLKLEFEPHVSVSQSQVSKSMTRFGCMIFLDFALLQQTQNSLNQAFQFSHFVIIMS